MADLPATQDHPQGRTTVLVADDEAPLRALCVRMLEKLGLKVITATNGREAVDLYRAQGSQIDLVILDLMMPHMDGQEAFAELRHLNPEVKVILASGYSNEDMAARFADKGITGVLQKPFTKANLQDLLTRTLPLPED